MARLVRVLGATAAAALSSACATAVPLPRVAPAEVRAVESEAYGSTLEELDRERNVRYWEIFLTDDEVVASLPPEVRSELAAGPVLEHAGSMHEVFVERSGFGALEIARLSPELVREAAGSSHDPTSSRELFELAAAAESMQAVVHRRVLAVGRRLAAAAGRPDVSFIPDAQVGLNAFVPIEFGANRVYVGTELALSGASDDELACSVGHELAHLTEGHTTSGAWANVGKQTIAIAAAAAIAVAAAQGNDGRPLTSAQIDGALQLGQMTSFLLADVPLRLSGWERGQEREADAVGLYYVWRAGYRPEACAENMLRLTRDSAAHGNAAGIWWWNVHPPSSERVVALRKLSLQARAGSLRYTPR